MERPSFVKLSDLVGDTFTVEKAGGYNFKMWDAQNRKMLISDNYQQGYRKIYTFTTDKGVLDLSSAQVGTLLEVVYDKGAADINGKTFEVKSNGKTGMDIRYFFNAIRTEKKKEEAPLVSDDELDEPLDMSQIPF
jgi:hypothetical protein